MKEGCPAMFRDGRVSVLAVVTLTALCVAWSGPVGAEDKCDPATSGGGGGGSIPQASSGGSGGGGSGGFTDASAMGNTLSTMPGWSFITQGVARGSQWLGDAYGRNVQGSSDPAPAPEPPRVISSPPAPDEPDYAVDGSMTGVPYGGYITRGAWWLGNWAGTTPAPQLGPGPGGEDPAPQQPAPTATSTGSGSGDGIWTQPLVKRPGPRFR